MKRLLLSTAILGAATLPVLAQDQPIFREAPEALELRASDFMGMRVYAAEAAIEGEEFAGVQEGWEDIGEINDIVMDRDGEVQAVLVDVGGFLGIGERTVAVSMDALRFVSDSATAEEVDDFFLVMNANREAIEGAPQYMDVQAEGMTTEQAAAETEQAIEEGGESIAAATGAAVEGTENALEETGEEIADAGEEVADEVADAGEEVSEEVAQVEMTDVEEDQAEVADSTQDAMEEASEETAQAEAEMADEAEMAAEATTETEMAVEQTAEAAAAGEMTTADTQEDVIVSNVPAEEGAAAEQTGEAEVVETEVEAETVEVETEVVEAETEVVETEQTSAETVARTPLVREGFAVAPTEDLTAERLEGAAVYDANDERVGEVGDIVLTADGQVQQLVIDVGGFLGLGEKPVALDMASLDILRQDGGEEIRVYVSQTEEELEAMDRYEVQ